MAHWADQLADEIIARAKKEGVVANVKCQQTPSGAKHIGNLCDVARAYLPYKAVVERGEKATFVHTTDDRDPLKDVPAKLADLNGNWHPASSLPDVSNHLGVPLFLVPDPFGCCKSWSVHFTKVWMEGVNALGMHPTLHSVNQLYEDGQLEPYVRKLFENALEAGKIVAQFQATKDEEYLPFDAICPNCHHLANVDAYDLDKAQVHFVCGGKAIKKRKSEGCGNDAWVPWRQGKLQWRFEWPALWGLFHTTFEPFGKDHFEGSWKSGVEIARRIYDIEPPIPFVYEFFLVNGEKMSASKGNVYLVQDLLRVLEPEAFLFYYAKRPEMQRDLDLSRLFALADEFDAAERVFFGSEKSRSENREENSKRMYELCVEKPPARPPRRVPYSFAAALIQLLDENQALEKLRELGHLGDDADDEVRARQRLGLAKNWIESYAADEFKIAFISREKARARASELSDAQRSALVAFADAFEKRRGDQSAQLQAAKDAAAAVGITAQSFFEAAYLVTIGKKRGPKLIPFLNALDAPTVGARLRGTD